MKRFLLVDMRLLLLSLAVLLTAASATAQTLLVRDLHGSPDDLIGVYGEPDEIHDLASNKVWRYFGADEGISRFYLVSESDVVGGSFMIEYLDESAAYARVFALTDGLSDLGFAMAERDGNGIYNAFGVGPGAGAQINVMKYPEVGGRFSYKVRLSIRDLPPTSSPGH